MSEKAEEVGNPIPSSRTELGIRLSALVALFPTKAAAARVAGKSVDQMKLYEKGGSAVPFEVVARLALDRAVSLEWLATGKGAMMAADRGVPGGKSTDIAKPLNKELLQDCVQVLEEILNERSLELQPDKKGRMVGLMYDYFSALGQIDRNIIVDLLKVAAA